jgi:hypothetical protein
MNMRSIKTKSTNLNKTPGPNRQFQGLNHTMNERLSRSTSKYREHQFSIASPKLLTLILILTLALALALALTKSIFQSHIHFCMSKSAMLYCGNP